MARHRQAGRAESILHLRFLSKELGGLRRRSLDVVGFARLREYAKLDKRAMLVGQLNKFQLWDEDTWNAVAEADLAAIKQPGALSDDLRDLIL